MSTKSQSHRVAARLAVWGAFPFFPFFLTPVYDQVPGATLSGTVTGQSGALTPDRQISIVKGVLGVTRQATTAGAGFHAAPNLIPGTYEVTASAPLATQLQTGITLTA